MKTWLKLTMVTILAVSFAASGCAKTQPDQAVSSTRTERFKQTTLIGKVNAIEANHISIQEKDGETLRVRIDNRTKTDRLAIGDQVKVYVTEIGYASTIEQVTN